MSDSTWPEKLRGTALYSSDGSLHLFNFYRSESLPSIRATLKEEFPDWFDDTVCVIGGTIDGEAVVLKGDRMFVWFLDTYEVARSTLTEDQFYQLVEARDPMFEEKFLGSLE